jgi:DNA-binding transcriptional LysR family regulator
VSLLGFSIGELTLAAEALREGSIREVARRHGIEPGNLSRLLKRIETACAETLAVRSRTGVRPTESGRRLLTTIAGLAEQARSFERSALSAARVPLIGIGAVPFVNAHLVAGAVAATLRQLRAKHRIRLIDLQPDEILSASLRGACDVCVHIGPLDWPKAWTTEELGALTWRMYSKLEFDGAGSEPPSFIYPVYWAGDGFIYGNDMHPVPLPRRELGIGVSSADAAARVLLEGAAMVGFLPDVVAREHVQQRRLAPIPALDAHVVAQPVYLTVRSDDVPVRLQRTLADAIREHLS